MMPQMPSREKLLAWIDQVSFAVVEMNLYLDTHPEDEDALAFFREKVELRKEALKQYAEQYDPLTIDTANDRMSRSFEWVMRFFLLGFAALAVVSKRDWWVLWVVEL